MQRRKVCSDKSYSPKPIGSNGNQVCSHAETWGLPSPVSMGLGATIKQRMSPKLHLQKPPSQALVDKGNELWDMRFSQ